MKPTLKITIGAGNGLKVEVLEAQGSGCVNLTEPLKAHGSVTNFEVKPEFYTQATTVGVTLTPDAQC